MTASLFLDDKPVTRTPSQIGNSGDSADSYETTVKAPKVSLPLLFFNVLFFLPRFFLLFICVHLHPFTNNY